MYATAHEYRARPGVLRDTAIHNLERWRKTLAKQMREAQAKGELATDLDVTRAVFQLVSYQNTAHLALMIGDDAMFQEAWRLTREYLRDVR